MNFPYPQLYVSALGSCAQDKCPTQVRLPNGTFLCEACVLEWLRRGWLNESDLLTCRNDLGRLTDEVRRLLASMPIESVCKKLQSEEGVNFFHLVPAVAAALNVNKPEARRLLNHIQTEAPPGKLIQ